MIFLCEISPIQISRHSNLKTPNLVENLQIQFQNPFEGLQQPIIENPIDFDRICSNVGRQVDAGNAAFGRLTWTEIADSRQFVESWFSGGR